MREERLGSYSIVATRARDAELVALEIDQAQLLLVPAAVVAHRQVARIAAAAGALLHRQQAACAASLVVMSSLTSVVLNRSVGVIGLYVLIAIVCFPKAFHGPS
jgi:hypothetical protein